MVEFYTGLHHPGDAARFDRACISIRALARRRKPLGACRVLVDSGAFMELKLHGRYRETVDEYAAILRRLHNAGVVEIEAAVAQDYMCEPFMLERTGLTVAEHQRLTIERYDALIAHRLPFPVMPVLQGYDPRDYVAHLEAYGDRLKPGMWVGVGSVCKRNGSPAKILAVLSAISAVRPDLRLHGFGIKKTALRHGGVASMLATADSMAWSYAGRFEGDANNVQRALDYAADVAAIRPSKTWQSEMPFAGIHPAQKEKARRG